MTTNNPTWEFLPQAFADALRKKRGAASLREEAKQSGVSAATLSRLENCKFLPDLITYWQCCRYLSVPMDTFFKHQ